jgi:hypothetical protein
VYILDTNTLIVIFRHYYRKRFPSFWLKFDQIVANQRILSVREVRNEVSQHSEDSLTKWSSEHPAFFADPTSDEITFVGEIFRVSHFQTLISKKSILLGKPVADPFIIAKAKILGGTVVTQELFKEHAAKVPNVCAYFGVPYCDLEQFMEAEGWEF